MIKIKHARLFQIFKLKRLLTNSKNSNVNFYSDFKGSLLNQSLRGNVYYIDKNQKFAGVIIINNKFKELYYIPSVEDFSIYKILNLLINKFDLENYKFSLIYKKINAEELKKYFSINITENLIYMRKVNCLDLVNLTENKQLSIRNMKIGREEALRAELQNTIFNNNKNRSLLTIDEVFIEERNPKFLKDFCFILEVQNTPAGYGQIILAKNQFFLVNFGIIPEYRNNGYGYYFLNKIIQVCSRRGIKTLYLSVDVNNPYAISLYKKMGFNEVYNTMTIKF